MMLKPIDGIGGDSYIRSELRSEENQNNCHDQNWQIWVQNYEAYKLKDNIIYMLYICIYVYMYILFEKTKALKSFVFKIELDQNNK